MNQHAGTKTWGEAKGKTIPVREKTNHKKNKKDKEIRK